VDPHFNDLKHEIEPMLSGFEQFVLRGNVVDMAVGVVGSVRPSRPWGAALTKDMLTPLIAALVDKPDFSAISFTVNKRFSISGISSTP
jgi:large conductance mechanosensitive channel